jgi:hypothetical protein
MFGRDIAYALDENMGLDMPAIEGFCERHRHESVMLFGFTFMIWTFFIEALKDLGARLELSGSMIHGGGWKKLAGQGVSNEQFKEAVYDLTGIGRVHNYYGMAEQTGSIFMECEHGRLHASVFSDISILDADSFSPMASGRGLIECASLLPTSYPGHRLLTEDEGELAGVDDCPCGRLGKTFKIYGRVKGAELRGCSDTYERH